VRIRGHVQRTIDELIEIGMAKAGSLDFQKHFSGADMRIWKILVTEIPGSVIDECFHGGSTPGNSLPSTPLV
jgi:hypothetical protein